MNYEEALSFIESKNGLGIRPGLALIKELLSRLGNPEKDLKILHIAGTNGKGSVFAFCENILLKAGYRVGRYISPSVKEYLERFQTDRKMMPEEVFAELCTRVFVCIEKMEADGFLSPTAFEIETAIAFLFFKESRVDYALIECGMGGALDATNAIPRSEVSVMAEISMDHMQFLGNSLSEIAGQKAGIIKPGGTLVSAPQQPEVREVLFKRCKEQGAECIFVDERRIGVLRRELSGTSFSYKEGTYEIKLLGKHQIINAVTAIETVKRLPEISEQAIKEGLLATDWPGRLSKVGESPDIYVDGAHNEAAWNTLAESCNYYFTNRRKIYIIGVLRDKDYPYMVKLFAKQADFVITVTPDVPRGLSGKELLACFLKEGARGEYIPEPKAALAKARELAGADGVILVCGSLSFLHWFL